MSGLYYQPVNCSMMGLELSIPDPQQVRSDYDSGGKDVFPFWSRVWPSALALSSLLQEQPHLIAGKKVLELGAGLGLPSFVSSSQAESVIVSDHIQEAVDWIDLNIEKLARQNMTSRLIDWKQRPLVKAEVILLSDIAYDPGNFTDIRDMIEGYIQSGSVILMSIPFRLMSAGFVTLMEEYELMREVVRVMDTEILLLALGATDFP